MSIAKLLALKTYAQITLYMLNRLLIVNIYEYSNIYNNVKTVDEESREFEEKQSRVYRRVWREERKGRNGNRKQ